MKNSLFFTALFISVLSIIGCNKESKILSPGPATTYQSDIFGLVLDENKAPVENATVTYGSLVQKTDKNGIYSFHKVDIDSRHSSLIITKDGYFNGVTTFSAAKNSTTAHQRTILLKKDFTYSFQSSDGGKLNTVDKVELDFPAASIIVESTGADYSGTVHAAIKYIDPTGDNLLFEMPGNLSAINNNQATQILTTYGMVAVELKSDNGEKLNVKQGKWVDMSVDIPTSLISGAPSAIPLWHFDEGSGYWKEEGSAILVNGKYTGKVNHFSYWNYDTQRASVQVTGKVVDQNGNPVAGAYIRFNVPGDYTGGQGETDDDGTYSGPVAKDEVLNVTVSSYNSGCSFTPLYNGQAGPFSNDATIPDIVVTIAATDQLAITGNFTDCNSNPVADGYIKIYNDAYNWYVFPIKNGQVNVSTSVCNNAGSYNLVAVDKVGLKESNPVPLTIPGGNNLGTVNICAANADFFTVVNPNIGINVTLTGSRLGVFIHDIDLKYVQCFDNAAQFSFYYNDGNTNLGFNTGTFNISGGTIFIQDGNGQTRSYMVLHGSDNGTTTITHAGKPDKKVIGTYALFAIDTGTGNIETFTGSFQLTNR